MANKVWTTKRKVIGNLLPMLAAIPFAAYGIFRANSAQNWFAIEALVSFVLAIAAAYLAVNFWGLNGNAKMRRTLQRRLATSGKTDLEWFVGIATPGYMNLWDPHEDIGFLQLTSSHVVFQGETRKFEIPKASVRHIGTKRNPHSFLLLGGWIVIDGILDHRPIRLYFEPRDKNSLLANKKLARNLLKQLLDWTNKN